MVNNGVARYDSIKKAAENAGRGVDNLISLHRGRQCGRRYAACEEHPQEVRVADQAIFNRHGFTRAASILSPDSYATTTSILGAREHSVDRARCPARIEDSCKFVSGSI